jgi:hypothetical protein
MLADYDEILAAVRRLPEDERRQLIAEIQLTLPEADNASSFGDPEFLEEMERRAQDPSPRTPAADIWKRDGVSGTLPESHIQELERRIAAADANPDAVEPWPALLERLSKKT